MDGTAVYWAEAWDIARSSSQYRAAAVGYPDSATSALPANTPLPPPRPADLDNPPIAPAASGLGAVAANDAAPVAASKNIYQGQTLENPAGISDNSGATVGGLGRAIAAAPQAIGQGVGAIASAPQSAADAVWGRMIQQESRRSPI